MRKEIISYARRKYSTEPEYLWERTPDTFILRNKFNKKWYAIVMSVRKSVFFPGDNNSTDIIDIINLRCNPDTRECLLSEGRCFPAYHMNKKNWISIILDGSVETGILCNIIDESYNIVNR